jgi:hypothetical protein
MRFTISHLEQCNDRFEAHTFRFNAFHRSASWDDADWRLGWARDIARGLLVAGARFGVLIVKGKIASERDACHDFQDIS